MPSRATVSSLLIAALFLGILFTLLATHERRPFYLLRERGGLWVQSFQEVEDRFRKGLSLSRPLVQLYNQGRLSALGSLPWPVVLPGRDGVLFYASEEAKDGPTMNDWRGQALPDDGELARWSGAVAERDRRLAALGIPYLLVMAPNKQTAMKEWMPRWVQHQEGIHRADVMLPALEGRLRTPPLDLRPLLAAESAAGRITYLRTDSHWNPVGAAVAAREIGRQLQTIDPRVVPLDAGAWQRELCPGFQGDILRLGHIHADLRETVPFLIPPQALPAVLADGRPLLAPGPGQIRILPIDLWQPDADGINTLEIANPAGIDGTLLLFHDSFGAGILPYLAQTYRRTVACWSPWSQRVVEREHPRIVIQLTVERYLHYVRKHQPDGARKP